MSGSNGAVRIFTNRNANRSFLEGRWWAEVENGEKQVIHTTPFAMAESDAVDLAKAWAKEHGYQWPPA